MGWIEAGGNVTEPVLAAQFGHSHPILSLTQHRHNLRLGERLFLIRILRLSPRENSTYASP